MKLHTRFLAATAAGLLALTTACGAGAPTDPAPAGSETPTETITVTHAQGTVELDGPAKRIVVLDHGSLDTVRALGASDAVVGVAKGQFLSDPVKDFADDTTYANVGTLQEPDFEKIAALEPDLIIAGFRSAKQQPELNKIAPTVDVTFAYDSATVQPQFQNTLDQVAATLRDYPSTYIDIYGHTDSRGSEVYNQGLSERRAMSVQSYLTSRGVQSARMATRGYGETALKCAETSEEGYRCNRRVEIRIAPVTQNDVNGAR